MAIFGRKKDDEPDDGVPEGVGAPASDAPFLPDPAKAARFFDRAKAVYESTNFEYATTLWLQGLRMDPTSVDGLEQFFLSAQAYAGAAKRDKPSKEQAKNFGGKGPLEKYLEELLHWGIKPTDVTRAVRAIEQAAKMGLSEPGYWIGERALPMALRDKPKKDQLLKLMQAFKKLEAFDLAVRAGEQAMALDRGDTNLDAEVRNLSAQMTMSRGGYERSGEEGGYRTNVRNSEAQRRLAEESQIVKSEDAATRVVEASKADWETRPTDRNAIARYARALQDRGLPEDEKTAFELLMNAYKETSEYRFRQWAGDLRIRHARRKLAKIRDAVKAKPDDAELQEKLRKGAEAFTRMEIEEFKQRVENYPTDLGMKYELGVRHFQVGEHEEAISLFQEAQGDPKTRSRCLNYLGQSFLKLGWLDEAIDTFQRASESMESQKDELALDVRYGLMQALERKAREHNDLSAAEEAYKIGSGIAVQQINFRDIRARRDALQKLVRELKGAASS
ncbi:MAG: hypothetical protein EA379_01070 [Phycisphaerales bacterium]|nr:MAG: hypothetical protein EA379_01070 [Phycisphaerales bacterium]